MTVTSTVVGILISIPVGLGAARNLAPLPVYYFCRSILAVSRSFQEVILAIFFVKLFGFGPFAGFLALTIATVGFYAKLLAEDIEDMEGPKPKIFTKKIARMISGKVRPSATTARQAR